MGISESGFPSGWGFPYARQVTDEFAAKVGCQGGQMRSCLMSKDAKTLLDNAAEDGNPFTTAGWGPSVDGSDMPDYPFKLFKQKQVNQVPLLAGTNTDEGTVFVWFDYPVGMSVAQYESFVPAFSNGHDPVGFLNSTEIAELYEIYPSSGSDAERRQNAASLITDATFLCGTLFTAKAHASDVFSYRFNHRSACTPSYLPGVYHGSEIPYIFGNQGSCKLTDDEKALMGRMQTVWTNFAKDLQPGTDFPKYDGDARQTLVFQTPSDVVNTDYQHKQCDFMERTSIKKYSEGHGGPARIVV